MPTGLLTQMKLSFCIIMHKAVRIHGAVRCTPFLTLALDEDETSASRPGRSTPEKKPPVPFQVKLVELQSQSGSSNEEKNLCLCAGNRKPIIQPGA
jgi:hypothetical protein